MHGLKGEEIPINARIIGIADTFDAMTANRVYRKQLDMAYVIQELKNGRGTQFDPGLVDVMLGLIDNGKIDICSLYKEHTHTDHSREKRRSRVKKVYLVTLCTCLVVIALVSASVYFLRDEEKEITVGFVYVGDASTAYTSNFIDAQEAIQTNTGIR